MKRIGIIVSILFAFIISIPIISSTSDIMNAAEEDDEIKFKDIYRFDNKTRNSPFGVYYAISEDGHLFYAGDSDYRKDSSTANKPLVKFHLLTDQNGEAIENVLAVAGWSTDYTPPPPSSRISKPSGVVLTTGGQLYAWGYNDYGQFGNGTISSDYVEYAVPITTGISDIVSVHCSFETTYLITASGDVYASGDNSKGQFGNGTTDSSTTFIKLPLTGVKKIASSAGTETAPGTLATYALKKDGTLYGWGAYVSDGKEMLSNQLEPVQIYSENGTDYLTNILDIDAEGSFSNSTPPYSGLAAVQKNGNEVNAYYIGSYSPTSHNVKTVKGFTVSNISQFSNVCYLQGASDIVGFVADGRYYDTRHKPLTDNSMGEIAIGIPFKKGYVKGGGSPSASRFFLLENGEIYINGEKQIVKNPLKISATKKDQSAYINKEKYNDDLELKITLPDNKPFTCSIEDLLTSETINCAEFVDNKANVRAGNHRIYRQYTVSNTETESQIIIDLYKENPQLKDYSASEINKIKKFETISLAVPNDQTTWNSYTATITDSSGHTSDYNGQALTIGNYTLRVTDSYGNNQDYQFEVKDNPTPTLEFNPTSSTLTYGDNPTKVNNTIGTFTLSYPAGEPTSNIKTI
ncbi:MAG: hypothetical protein HFE82_05005, partial [Erysipelotrichaceae bacterium]|nr:hypothetical protein [Erysipelotrichaceae bacterium]